MANVIYTVPLAESALISALSYNLLANSNANVYIGGGSNGQALITDGLGNLSWSNITGNGTVTLINTSGNGLGFSLTGGPISTTGTITLTVPNATSLRTSLNIGNVANLDLNGNGATALRGNGAFIAYGNIANLDLNGNGTTYLSGNGTFSVPPGTYSNSNVASYLPTYNGNIGANVITANVGNITTINATTVTATTGNITTINSTTGNFSGNVSGNIIIANTANITGNVNAGNVNGGNLVTANYISGNGYLLTGVTANFANYAGQVTNSSQPNITSVGTLTSLTVSGNINGANIIGNHYGNGAALSSITGANVTGTVANATFATTAGSATTAGTVTTAAQPNITSVGTLTSLTVSGNITAGNANLGNNVSANYFTGNGYYLTGISVPNTANANFANYAGNVTISSQPNITSLGTLTGLTVNGISNLGNIGNVKITGGTNGYTLQTDGAGNLSWISPSGSGNGVVGGSNTQIQFNDAGLFNGNSGLTFDKTTGITTVNYGNVRGLIKNKGQVTTSNISGNTVILNFDILNGPVLINTAGLDIISANANVSTTAAIGLNFRGNSTVSLNSLLNVGDSINLKFIQRTSFQLSSYSNPGSGARYSNITLYLGYGSYVPALGPFNQIDSTDIDWTSGWTNGETTTGNAIVATYDTTATISQSWVATNIAKFGYLAWDIQITKITSDPDYIIKMTEVT